MGVSYVYRRRSPRKAGMLRRVHLVVSGKYVIRGTLSWCRVGRIYRVPLETLCTEYGALY